MADVFQLADVFGVIIACNGDIAQADNAIGGFDSDIDRIADCNIPSSDLEQSTGQWSALITNNGFAFGDIQRNRAEIDGLVEIITGFHML